MHLLVPNVIFVTNFISSLCVMDDGGGIADVLRKKYERFSYPHLGINVVSFDLKTWFGVCTPHEEQ